MKEAANVIIGLIFCFGLTAIIAGTFSDLGDWMAKRRRVRVRVSKDDFAFAKEAAAEAGFTRPEEYFAVLVRKALRAERH